MKAGRVALGLLFLAAGVTHFATPKSFIAIVPDYLPAHRELVLISGAAELAGGLGVLLPGTRRAAAWGLVALLVCVFPANLWMAQHAERFRPIPAWALWARLTLQVPLLWWAWLYTRREQRVLAEQSTATS